MNNRQSKLKELKTQIIKNVESKTILYYQICLNKYSPIESYLDQLDNVSDKIALAQWSLNYDLVEQMIKDYAMTEEEQQIYDDLSFRNENLNETLNPELLSSKFGFLRDMLDMITADIDVQQQLIGLSDEGLELFKQLYVKISEITDYKVPIVSNVLRSISFTPFKIWQNNPRRYDKLFENVCELIKNDYPLSDDNLESLLYLFTTKGVMFSVETVWDLNDFGKPNSKDFIEIDKYIDFESEQINKNIDNIKMALLLKTFGISLSEAKEILTKYDVSNLEITVENKDVIEMHQAILQIFYETNPELLIEIYNDFVNEMSTSFDCLRIVVFENDLRKIFARELNNQVYKINGDFSSIKGVDVYEAGLDFKMIVTAIGAYQDEFTDKSNYSDYWNSSSISSHANCCSLIANNNLSIAPVKNIVLGFSTMSDNMLLLSGEFDINSTPSSKLFDVTSAGVKSFLSPNDMINNTRGDYNELVYERRDLKGTDLFYKKNPDYIVFIEEYEDIDACILEQTNEEKRKILLERREEQKRKWRESLKAAKNFNVPIVKINKEKCAKNELNEILKCLELYKETHNPKLLTYIITEFENNRVGNPGVHNFIREKYFSERNMELILSEIYITINSLTDKSLKGNNIEGMISAINLEKQRVDICRYFRRKGQTSGFDFETVLQTVGELKVDMGVEMGAIKNEKAI